MIPLLRRRSQARSSHEGVAITLGTHTHVGMRRSNNEDAYCALLGPNAPSGASALLAVADGMGGHRAGEVASTMAIQGLVSRLSRKSGEDGTLSTESQQESLLEQVVQQVNGEVFQAATRPEMHGMGTTLTVAMVAGSSLHLAHVGDSRGYLLRKGELSQLTRDHSWVAEQVAAGLLTPEQAQSDSKRNILTRALGTAPCIKVDTTSVQLEEGDVLLLCSDGLHSLVTDEKIAQVLAKKEPQGASKALVDNANALGGNDNITVVVAHVGPQTKKKAASDSRQDLHNKTTLEFRVPSRGRGKLATALLLTLSPLWLPFWILARLVRFWGRRG